MNTMPEQPETQQTSASIKDRVLAEITEKSIEPRSKSVFVWQNRGVWGVWVFSVALGALATSVLIFTSSYRYYDVYEAMHDNFVTFFFEALPVLWVLAFILLMAFAVRGLRATKRGYRLSLWLIGGSSVGLSLLLGVVASAFGFGYVVDKTLGTYAPMYYSQAEREQQIWLAPEQGRLVGRTVELIDPMTLRFIDIDGGLWQMKLAELRPSDRDLLVVDRQVRVLGVLDDADTREFFACGVFPWMMDKQRSMRELSASRRAMVEQIYRHHDATERRSQIEEALLAEVPPGRTRCAELAAVRRVSESMR